VSSPDGITGTIAAVTKELGQAGIAVTADVPSDLRLPSASLVALTRVIRESATNVLKHATGAHTVSIVLRVERGWVHLTFADDSPPARTAGLPASGTASCVFASASDCSAALSNRNESPRAGSSAPHFRSRADQHDISARSVKVDESRSRIRRWFTLAAPMRA
jgi:hypothetical protein